MLKSNIRFRAILGGEKKWPLNICKLVSSWVLEASANMLALRSFCVL